MTVSSPTLDFSVKDLKLIKELTEVTWVIDLVPNPGPVFMAEGAKASGLSVLSCPFQKGHSSG